MFKTLTSALKVNENPTDEDIRKIPSYIFCRWLSANPHSIKAANSINIYSNIPIENQYYMIKSAFGGKIKYIPYPKNISEESLKKVEYVSEHFKVSLEKAKEYINLIDPKELDEIVQMYSDYDLKR